VIFLIVGIDRNTFAAWHEHIRAGHVAAAKRIAHARAAAMGIDLVIAAAIGPYSDVITET
jgi:hypothetical protein